jgi:hypothetical protein
MYFYPHVLCMFYKSCIHVHVTIPFFLPFTKRKRNFLHQPVFMYDIAYA